MKPDMMLAGVLAKKHTFTLPLNYQQPIGEQISVFARELCAIENVRHEQRWCCHHGGDDLFWWPSELFGRTADPIGAVAEAAFQLAACVKKQFRR